MADTNNNNGSTEDARTTRTNQTTVQTVGNAYSNSAFTDSVQGAETARVIDVGSLLDFDFYRQHAASTQGQEGGAEQGASSNITINFGFLPPSVLASVGLLGENGVWTGTIEQAEQLEIALPSDFEGIVTGQLPLEVDGSISHGKFHIDVGPVTTTNLLAVDPSLDGQGGNVSLGDVLNLPEQDATELGNAEGLSVRLGGLSEGMDSEDGTYLGDGVWEFSGLWSDLSEFTLSFSDGYDASSSITVEITKSFAHGFEVFIPLEDYDAVEGEIEVGVTGAMDLSGSKPAIIVGEGDDAGLSIRLADYLGARVTDEDGSEEITRIEIRLSGLPDGARLSDDGGASFNAGQMSGGILTYEGDADSFANLILSLPPDFATGASAISGLFSAYTNEYGRGTQGFDIRVAPEADIELSAQNVVAQEETGAGGTTVELKIDAAITDADLSEGNADTPNTVTIIFDRLPEGTTANGGILDVDGLTWTGSINEANALSLTFPEDYSTTAKQVAFGDNLIVNGSFEQTHVGDTDWGSFTGGDGVPGWSGERVEIQNTHWGHKASNGSQWLELDAELGVDTVSQDIHTDAGTQYQLSFDVSTRFFNSSTFDVSWNGEVISTVIPEGREWETITLTVEGTGGVDRLAFTEMASQDSCFGAFIDNVKLFEAIVMDEAPIVMRTTVQTPEGAKRTTTTLEVKPTHDIVIDQEAEIFQETDEALVLSLSEIVSVKSTDADGSEIIESITINLNGLPDGTLVSAGTLQQNGSFSFTGTTTEFASLTIMLPKDYSTQNPAAQIVGTVSAKSNEGQTSAYPVSITVESEGDIALSYSDAMTMDGESATIALSETGTGDQRLEIVLSDYLEAAATDADLSESLIDYSVSLTGLPADFEYSTDGGVTFQKATVENGEWSFTGPASDFADLVVSLPPDYSTTSPNAPISGSFAATTDEGGQASIPFGVSVEHQADISMSADDSAGTEDSSGVGASVHLGLNFAITDRDLSEGDGDTPDTVRIEFDRLPDGTTANAGNLDVDGLSWTGSVNQANALTLTFPEHYSSTHEVVLKGGNLLTDGSFEAPDVGQQGWASFENGDGVTGWQGERIEIQKEHWAHDASEGRQWLELDAEREVDSVYQDVQTERGTDYQLSFDVSTRFLESSGFEVSWNGELVETVEPSGRDWTTVTLTVQGTGGMDRLAFTELEHQNDALGAFIDNVQLIETELVETGPITLNSTLTTSEGSNTITSTVEVIATQDIAFDGDTVALAETDDTVTFTLSDYVKVGIEDTDFSEVLETVTIKIDGLPSGATTSHGQIDGAGTLTFEGTLQDYLDLAISLPKDFSTQNPATSIAGTITAKSNEGQGDLHAFSITVSQEADLSLDYTDNVLQSDEGAFIRLAHTDTQGQEIELRIEDYFIPQAIDIDGSESLTTISLSLGGLPSGSTFSTDGGQTYLDGAITNGELNFTGSAELYSSLVLYLPPVNSSSQPFEITGDLIARTDEGGVESLPIKIVNDRIIEDAVTQEDADGVGVSVDVGFSVSSAHVGEIGDNWDTPNTVTIKFDRLPEGSSVNTGYLDADSLSWTGSINEANALELQLPEDFATNNFYEVNGENLIVNGSFEDADLQGRSWGSFDEGEGVAGWQGTRIEIQDEGLGYYATDGRQWLELDAEREVDTIYQDVQTTEGALYELSFDVSTRVWNSSNFEVAWNGEAQTTVIPKWGEGWTTVTLQVEGTGGLDRLSFTEDASQNNAFGALIDNVVLRELEVIESKPIELETTIDGEFGPLQFTSSISVTPTEDIDIIANDILSNETDAPVVIRPADSVSVLTSDSDGSETLESITVKFSNLPDGAIISDGSADSGGGYTFTGSPAEFAALTFTLPTDFATEGQQPHIVGDVSAISNEGQSTVHRFYVKVFVEGDAEAAYTDNVDQSGDNANIALAETDSGSEGLDIRLADYFVATATDQDGSESVSALQFTIDGLPQGTLFSQDGGLTFDSALIENGVLNYSGSGNPLEQLVLKLPADFSTTNPQSQISGSFAFQTDEGGYDGLPFTITVSDEPDLVLAVQDKTTFEDASGQGVTLDLGINAAITDADGSEGTNSTQGAVTISFSHLPAGVIATTGTLDIGELSWTGTAAEASALTLKFPSDYSTTSGVDGEIEGPINYSVTITSPEGQVTKDASITIQERQDIEIQSQNLAFVEDDAVLPLNLSAAITDSDGSEEFSGPIRVEFTDLPDGTQVNTGVLDSDTGVWQGTPAELQTLALSNLPEHFSGIIPAKVVATSNEGQHSQTFSIAVVPVPEPTLDMTVTAHSQDGQTHIVKEDTPFTIGLTANTVDQDGSETLTKLVIENLPDGWIAANDEGVVDPSAFSQGGGSISVAIYDGSTGTLTLEFTDGLHSWDGALTLTPSGGTSLDIGSLMGGELTATLTVTDTASGLDDVQGTAAQSADIDVDAVVDDPSLAVQDRVLNEDLDSSANSKLRIRSLSLGDKDGSEKYGDMVITITVDETASDNFSIADSVTLYSSVGSSRGTIELLSSDASHATYKITQPDGASDSQFEGFVKNLRISYPQNFSGKFSADGTLDVYETVASGDKEYDLTDNATQISFDTTITVQPIAEADLTIAIEPASDGFNETPLDDPFASVSATVGDTPPTVEIFEDSSFTLKISASTPDRDGSEEISSITIQNVPNLWFSYSVEGIVDTSIFGDQGSSIETATYNEQTGELKLEFTDNVESFEGSLLLTPIAHDDRDVDAVDGLEGQDSSGFFGDINVTLTTRDVRSEAGDVSNEKSVSVGIDIDVEAVNDVSALPDAFAVSEAVVDAAGGWVDIPLFPTNPDIEGSETIETLGIYGIPKGVVVFYRGEDGDLHPAKLIAVDFSTGMTDWALENGQWEGAVLRGIPQHFSGVLTANPNTGEVERSTDGSTSITARVLTREINDLETGQTETGELRITITPSVDGGNPNQSFNVLEDTAFNPNIDGNLIDKSDGSPEELTGDVTITVPSQLLSVDGREIRFFLGDPEENGQEIFADGAGVLTVDSADIGDLFILPPKDSNEDFSLGITFHVREATDPDGPVKTESGTLSIDMKGVADTPLVFVPEGGESEAYVGTDQGAFVLDTSTGGADGAATRLGGLMTEMMPDQINFDGSENLYFIITGDSLSTMAQQSGSIQAPPSVSFANGIDTGAGAVIVSAADIGNLSFLPVDVSETTDYKFTLNAVVVENDEQIPTGTNIVDASALHGVSIASADFYVRVSDAGNFGGGEPVVYDLPDPPDVTLSPVVGTEDEEASFTITLNNYDGDFSQIPREGSIEITGIPKGSVVRAEPADAISYNPITGSYFVNHAVADEATTYYVSYPEHMSSADTPHDGLDTLSVTGRSLHAQSGQMEAVEYVTSVYIDPVADGPTVTIHSGGGFEDTLIPITFSSALVDPGEELDTTMQLSLDASQGVLADVDGVPLTPVSSGGGQLVYEVSSDLGSLNLLPTLHRHGDVPISVTATTREPNGDQSSASATVNVHVEAVADVGIIEFDQSLVNENMGGELLPVVVGVEDTPLNLESVIATSTPDQDGSEVYNITLLGVPDYLSVNVGTDNGLDENGLRSFTMTPEEYSTLEIGFKEANSYSGTGDIPSQLRLSIKVNTLELSNGDTESAESAFIFKVLPAADTPTISVADAQGNEDQPISLVISAEVSDAQEVISHYIIREIPEGGQILVNGQSVATGPQEASIPAGSIGSAQFLPPADASGDFTLKVVSVAQEPNADPASPYAFKESDAADLTVSVDPQVDVDLAVSAENAAQGDGNTLIELDVSAAVTDQTGPNVETLEEVTITFSNLPSGTTFNSGTFDQGSQSLTLSRSSFGSEQAFVSSLSAIAAILPAAFFGTVTGQAQATTSEGTSDPVGFSFNINAKPVSDEDVSLDRSGLSEFTITQDELLATFSDPDSSDLAVRDLEILSGDAAITQVQGSAAWTVSLNGGVEGDLVLSYSVTDGEDVAAFAQATATVSVDNTVSLTMSETGETIILESGVTAAILDDVSGSAQTYDTAVGSDEDEAVVVTQSRDYDEVDAFQLMGGQDLVDLSLASEGFVVDLGSGNDMGIGSAGNDTMFGGAGSDVLSGGAGQDTLYGGTGADSFVISNLDAVDAIADFSAAEGDVVDLTGLFEVSTDVSDYVRYDNETGELSVDKDGAENGADFTLAATMDMIPTRVVVEIDDGSNDGNVVI
ncbi:DUF642 domain-containing protein [Rhodobacteraceae bacterium RKSG542]|uniref:DUF642 domain-containing protein n=1 Tax=Pseudovibrio flavus TaxID=2529854 RepID=UPI0012BC463C|nr:DUF642 domain-containing protein [Pseudovibrio flavus]MTI15776.1 DUF642 domain-containing protein [Pseudovibrio flavus]